MKKLNQKTPDLTEKNIDKIAELFPGVITEKKNTEDGDPVRAIDFDLLKQTLDGDIVDGPDERYRLDWPGKRASLLKANTPIPKTLRPDHESSVDFDTTQNVFIEGDNFEALKILQESYLGKVKMIYIDPPYNTGKDFVYTDNFTQDKDEYNEEIEAVDEEGNKMFKENTKTNPRFHSDWLSMMYERLTIARDLLKDDGVIFISIGVDEVHNLRKICDEIYGTDNHIETIVWNKRIPKNDKGIGSIHEYVLIYVRNIDYKHQFLMAKEGLQDINNLLNKLKQSETSLPDAENEIKKLFNKKAYDRGITLYNSLDSDYRLWGKINMSWPNSNTFGPTYEVLHPETGKPVKKPERGWRWKIETFEEAAQIVDGKYTSIKTLSDGSYMCGRIWFSLSEDIQPSSVSYLDELDKLLLRTVISLKSDGGIEVEKLFNGKSFFSYPKPTALLKLLINSIDHEKSGIYVDFFAGSATTAQALMKQNAEDGGNRKFIMVQLQEETSENSEASRAGYKTIADIGRERIRRAAEKIKVDYAEKLAERDTPLDTGFRAYKVADTAFEDVERHPAELEQGKLMDLSDNIKSDRTPADLLTQVMLELGLTLDKQIEEKKVGENTVFYVAGNALVTCFDEKVPLTLIDEIAKCEPLQVVFKDASFGSDDDLINAETHLKRLSPETILSVL